MTFFKPPVSFSLNIASPFSVTTFFCSTLYTLDKKVKIQILRFLSAPVKFMEFLMSFKTPQVIFPLKFASIFSIMTHNSSVLF